MHAQRPAIPWASYGAALLATLFWGLSFVAVRVALEGFTPCGLVWARNVLGATALFSVLRARGRPLLPERGDLRRCLLLGAILGVHQMAQSLALELTTAIRAGWTIAFIPAVVALLAATCLRRGLRPLGWLGIALATGGVLTLNSARPADLARAGWGDLLMLATCFTWAAYTLLSVAPMSRSGALRVSACSMSVAVLPNLAAAAVTGTWHTEPGARSVAALAFLGLCAGATALWAYNRAVSDLGPERASAFQYLQPLVTLAGSLVLLGEPFTRAALLGGPIVLAGVWMVQRARPTLRGPGEASGRIPTVRSGRG